MTYDEFKQALVKHAYEVGRDLKANDLDSLVIALHDGVAERMDLPHDSYNVSVVDDLLTLVGDASYLPESDDAKDDYVVRFRVTRFEGQYRLTFLSSGPK